ncbi:hypothetical protein N473_07030 [Pseudoalteromonas luteoviolacea CPMOR-1]|uniref:HTH cro/C1-type domain-containing protein n=1 Tax=Pseudoalteromonas luteoviolacea CPMOR-1 TaxID=1365248 RepID=A0A167H4G4_9GAMM|nr:helix-turn-helix domain-containing protein [Pseudoalteromonas luteoviolacea]KZN57622.1 hypothetical protein N473_07030 [Pseudoalteromonas luteoviolacea CPMOR-1]
MKAIEIKHALSKKGLNLSMIAEALEVKRSAVSNVVNGKSKSHRIAQAISKVIDKPLKEVFPEYPNLPVLRGEQRTQEVMQLREQLLAS